MKFSFLQLSHSKSCGNVTWPISSLQYTTMIILYGMIHHIVCKLVQREKTCVLCVLCVVVLRVGCSDCVGSTCTAIHPWNLLVLFMQSPSGETDCLRPREAVVAWHTCLAMAYLLQGPSTTGNKTTTHRTHMCMPSEAWGAHILHSWMRICWYVLASLCVLCVLCHYDHKLLLAGRQAGRYKVVFIWVGQAKKIAEQISSVSKVFGKKFKRNTNLSEREVSLSKPTQTQTV